MIPGDQSSSAFVSGWAAEESPMETYSLSSVSIGADADGPYLCSGIMNTQRCASQIPPQDSPCEDYG